MYCAAMWEGSDLWVLHIGIGLKMGGVVGGFPGVGFDAVGVMS